MCLCWHANGRRSGTTRHPLQVSLSRESTLVVAADFSVDTRKGGGGGKKHPPAWREKIMASTQPTLNRTQAEAPTKTCWRSVVPLKEAQDGFARTPFLIPCKSHQQVCEGWTLDTNHKRGARNRILQNVPATCPRFHAPALAQDMPPGLLGLRLRSLAKHNAEENELGWSERGTKGNPAI